MCVQSNFPESLKVKNRESDRYTSEEKVWVDCCDCNEKYKTSGLNSTQHNTKLNCANSAEYVSYIHQELGVNSRLQTVRIQARRKEHLAAVLIWNHFHWSVLERLWREEQRWRCQLFDRGTRPQTVCLLCFLNQGDFITKNYGAGDRLCQPACLSLFGLHLSGKVSTYRCMHYLTIYYYLQSLLQWGF